MAEQKPKDWSRVESRMKSRKGSAESESVQHPIRVVDPAAQSLVPTAIEVPHPDTESQRGILMKLRRNQIDRRTAIAAIQSQYEAQLDALRYQLRRAVNVSHAQADRIAEEFLKKLDSEHIQVLKDLGLKNAETRATALIEVREMIATKLREVQSKDWPESLVNRTIDDLLDLEKRACAELMRELGGGE